MKHFIFVLGLLLQVVFCTAQFTIDQCSGGVATASSQFSATYSADKAFDDVYNLSPTANCWASNAVPSVGTPQWLQYDFGAGNDKTVTKYVITARNALNDVLRTPRDWTLEASVTGAFAGEEVVLDAQAGINDWAIVQTGVNAVFPTTHEYEIANTQPYRYYRLRFTANNGGSSYVAVGEVELMETEAAPSSGNEGSVWYFGYNAAVDFKYNPPRAITSSNMTQWEGCASICDVNGDLLFYTNGGSVWGRDHKIMPNGAGLLGDAASTQSSVIVPNPGNDSIYYIFTAAKNGEVNGFRYTAVNMNLNGGLGDVEPSEKNVLINTPHSEKMTAVQHANGQDIWVVTHNYGLDFQAYLVTSSGINVTPVVSTVGSTHAGGVNNWNAAGYMKVSPGGNKIAVNILASSKTELFDFDNATGIVSNPITLTSSRTRCYGLEFSPDNSKLYTTSWMGNTIVQYDLSLGSAAAIIASENVCATSDVPADGSSNFKGLGAMQIAPDGKIYVTRDNVGSNGYFDQYNKYLGVINNPNDYGAASNYNDYGIYLNGRGGGLGLPNFIQSLFVTDFYVENLCVNDTAVFTISNTNAIDSVNWDFNDPASGINNTSTNLSPVHIFTASGNYTVQLVYHHGGISDTITHLVAIHGAPVLNLGNDLQLCNGDSVQLNAGSGMVNYLWSTGDTVAAIYVSSSDSYFVQITDTNTCSNSDTIQVDFVGQADATIMPVGAYCNSDGVAQLTAADPGGIWSGTGIMDSISGNFDPSQGVTGSNQIIYTISGSCGDADTINVTVYESPSAILTEMVESCNGAEDGSISAQISGGSLPYTYVWSNGETDSVIANLASGPYSLAVTSSDGCTATVSTTLGTSPIECESNNHVYVANVFSPNGDLNNDVLYIQGDGIETLSFVIYDRWGEKVFETTDSSVGWDGTFNGEMVNSAVFVYVLKVTYSDSSTEEKNGTITLLK